MLFTKSITLSGLPKGPNGGRTHWAYKKRWRSSACLVAKSGDKPRAPLQRCKIVCIRFSSSKMDYDNLVASFKPIIDGIVDARIIADDCENVIVSREYTNAKAAPKHGRVVVIVQEVLT